MIAAAWVVFLKELRDALRDRRTLTMVLLSSVAIGPLVLVAISQLVAGIEKRAEAREIYAGLERVSGRFLDVTLGLVGAVPYEDWLKTAVRRQKPVVELYPGSPSALALQGIARRVEAWVPPAAARGHLEFFVERLLQQPQGMAA